MADAAPNVSSWLFADILRDVPKRPLNLWKPTFGRAKTPALDCQKRPQVPGLAPLGTKQLVDDFVGQLPPTAGQFHLQGVGAVVCNLCRG